MYLILFNFEMKKLSARIRFVFKWQQQPVRTGPFQKFFFSPWCCYYYISFLFLLLWFDRLRNQTTRNPTICKNLFYTLTNAVAGLCCPHPLKMQNNHCAAYCCRVEPVALAAWAEIESYITGQDGVGGFASSNQILSPCGIPLIFSSEQIRL